MVTGFSMCTWTRRRIRWTSSCATGPDGGYHGNLGHRTSVIVDYPFITGRSTPDSVLTGQKLIEVLDGDPPLLRWGW
jgi:hypothetical protein